MAVRGRNGEQEPARASGRLRRMMAFPFDRLVFGPDDVDLSLSPLARRLEAETYVLGAFNPGLTRLPNGNLLMMVRVAEALREPVLDGHVCSIRWVPGGYALDAWPLDAVDMTDPRAFRVRGGEWRTAALTSLSWLLPVELDAGGTRVERVHYSRAVAPAAEWAAYGLEDARISRVGGRWLMTACAVSPERQGTAMFFSDDALDWRPQGLVLDHQNKDMLVFEGQVDGRYWAQTRPLGDQYFAYSPGSEWMAGPSINLATSPDALHWRPHAEPGIRPRRGTPASARMGGGAPPVMTEVGGVRGWLSLWHGVEPRGAVGVYRTYWTLLDPERPWVTLADGAGPLLEPAPALTAPFRDRMYVEDVVFTTGIVDGGDHWVVASGEADLACRITHIPKRGLRRAA